MLLRLLRLALVLSVVILGSCTIYTPLQPPAPDICAQGQLEVSQGMRLSTHVEGAVAYSPLKHLMIRAAGGGTPLPPGGPMVQFATGQMEGGLGTYWSLKHRWLAGGVFGSGGGQSRLKYPNSVAVEDYRARFRRHYGEAYLHWYASPYVSLGTMYRLNQVRYSAFTNAGASTHIRTLVRSEPLVFVRVGADQRHTEMGALQGQLSLGLSMAHGPRPRRTDDITDRPLYQAKLSTLYTTLSVIVRPHLLWKTKNPPSNEP
ncbi:hypothetical protein GCM10027048_24720 [Hymenobacter coalescens]